MTSTPTPAVVLATFCVLDFAAENCTSLGLHLTSNASLVCSSDGCSVEECCLSGKNPADFLFVILSVCQRAIGLYDFGYFCVCCCFVDVLVLCVVRAFSCHCFFLLGISGAVHRLCVRRMFEFELDGHDRRIDCVFGGCWMHGEPMLCATYILLCCLFFVCLGDSFFLFSVFVFLSF